MPNVLGPLKAEIRRLTRREIRQETAATRKAAIQHRREIAALKRMIASQGKLLAKLEAQPPAGPTTALETNEKIPDGFRFSGRSVRAQRKRLKLSALEFAKLLGVSMQTVYVWEQGRARPRRSQIVLLAGARKISRRDAHRTLGLIG